MSQLLTSLIFAGLLGMIGQGVRSLVGLKGIADQTADPAIAAPKTFSAARLLVSLLIGFIAGALAGIALGLDKLSAATPDKETLLGLMAAGYAGTDFIEGFMSRYLPGAAPQPPDATAPRAVMAAVFQNTPLPLAAAPAVPFAPISPAPLAAFLQPPPSATSPLAARIKAACEAAWPANKADCSAFVRAVAQDLGATITGDANQIAAALHSTPQWQPLPDGPAATAAASAGKFVIGGLPGAAQANPTAHGHVVVVVDGPLNRGKYPTAYWGSLAGTPAKDQTTNWAWAETDRDNVVYAAYEP